MTETFPGYEDYSTKYFEEMIKRCQEEEEARRVETGVKACKLDLCFAVNEWMTSRSAVLQALGVVIDKMLEVGGRTTGTFNAVVELNQ